MISDMMGNKTESFYLTLEDCKFLREKLKWGDNLCVFI